MLPMQRITRFPLLIDAVLKRLDQSDDEYPICQSALSILNNIVHQCNEAARQTEHMAELCRLSRLLEYPQYITPVQLVPRKVPRRVLVRSGELTQISCRGDDGGPVTSNKLTFGKKLIKTVLNFFLFTDVMIIAKKKSDENYMVVGHCPRSLITVIGNGPEGGHIWPGKEAPAKHMLLLTILENHEGKTVEMFLSCASESDRQRWLEAWSPPSSDNPDEVLYEDWDCPQLIARHQYLPRQPDELGLEPGDVINVNRKMADGWYHGERIRDGAKGWFPGNYTEEIGSPHLRARYLKQRYRLMAYNANFEQRRKR
ncbi:rho guanine nucleotide exchange factor 26-like [Ctenocephalides felis]|uniref:rho guanine nucleotide exchange factor 26-like n=1 Tax=Ctenocephalides felis TaxID=7515 RepID=UPI000E6E1E8D|nr:rho guanine nucleotide exchange factor 26-like [Ctenocephalides felis]